MTPNPRGIRDKRQKEIAERTFDPSAGLKEWREAEAHRLVDPVVAPSTMKKVLVSAQQIAVVFPERGGKCVAVEQSEIRSLPEMGTHRMPTVAERHGSRMMGGAGEEVKVFRLYQITESIERLKELGCFRAKLQDVISPSRKVRGRFLG